MKIILFIVVFSHVILLGQSSKKLLMNADYYFNVGDYYSAAKYYKNALKTEGLSFEVDQVDIEIKLAHSYRLYNDYEKALEIYQYIYEKDKGRKYPEIAFWYAMMLKSNAQYVQARKYFLKSLRLFKRQRHSYFYKKIKNEKLSCQFAKENCKDTLDVEVDNSTVGINTTNSEFAPNIIDGQMIFSSLRADKISEDLEVFEENYKIKLYQAKDLNSVLFNFGLEDNIGNGCSSKEGYYYFSRCDSVGCKIWVGKWLDNQLVDLEVVRGDINLPGATFTQAFICEMEGEEVILYVSDRSDGYGRLDIWYAPMKDYKTVGPSVNLGHNVNSIDNDMSPYYDEEERTLYFASEGHLGFGGFDLFKVRGQFDNYNKPTNLMLPFNSSANDMYFHIDTINNNAFLVSNRKGSLYKKAPTCCNDIWKIEGFKELQEDTIIDDLVELNKKLPVILYFHNDCPDPKTRDTVSSVDYMESFKDYMDLQTKYTKEFAKTVNEEEKEKAKETINDFFEYTVAQGVEDLQLFMSLLEKALEKGESIKITVQGHASPLAKSDYNINLTRRRISSLKNYFKIYKNGILQPYLEGDSARILIEEVPFGEYISDLTVSDDYFKTSESVYSVHAASERRIEIISVQRQQKDSVYAALMVSPKLLNMGLVQPGDSVQAFFEIENEGNMDLKVDSVYFEGNLLTPAFTLQPGATKVLVLNWILPSKLDRRGSFNFFIRSNAYNNNEEIIITYEGEE